MGCELRQEVVLEILQLKTTEKGQATSAMKKAFPWTNVKRKHVKQGYVTVYTDVACKSFSYTSGISSLQTATVTLNDSPDIVNIKALIGNVSTELDSVVAKIAENISDVKTSPDISSLVQLQKKLQTRLSDLNDNLIKLYQREIDQILQNQSHCEALCGIEKRELDTEMSHFVQYLNIDILSRYRSSSEFEDMFQAITTSVRENCPLLFDIIHTEMYLKNVL